MISIVIPNFNGEELLKKNIPRVVSASLNPENKIEEIIVVDDGSTDGSVDFLKSNFPQIMIIKHKINRGFSASVNTGVRTSKGDLIALINNDVTPSIDFLIKAILDFKDPKVFAVSLNEGKYGWSKGKFENGFIVHEPGERTEKSHETFWVSAGSGVFRRSVWISLGGMDESLFSPFYWEDVDLSYRAAKRGYRLLWEPKAIVEHEHEATIKNMPRGLINSVWERNQLLFIWKNLTSPSLFRKHLVGVFKRVASHPGYIKVVFSALAKVFIVMAKRAKEKKESKISDEAIFARFTPHQ